ncbi:MAG: hypothetical protein WCK57_13105 [Verrucomicrobiae bacterium]|jgi:hypothetical protein
MKNKLAISVLTACVIALGACKPKVTPEQQMQQEEQQKQQEERLQKTQEIMAKRDAERAHIHAVETTQHHNVANANISYDDYNVRIKNVDTNDWPELNVYLNPGKWGPMSGYGIRIPSLQIGKGITIPLSQFTKDNGERFNPSAYKVTELWMGGGNFDYEKFGAN